MQKLTKASLEELIRTVIAEQLQNFAGDDPHKTVGPNGVTSVRLPLLKVSEDDRLDTGEKEDVVYTKDLFTLEESPRLGCGLMEMKETTFDWTLNYDEIDYVIEGHLDIIIDGRIIRADKGEVILIPAGSRIQFSVPEFARFLYVTYPADWANQA
ncbi:MAG: ethanolamine utilization protein EutQ [Bacillus sp. (in: firmicutes)]